VIQERRFAAVSDLSLEIAVAGQHNVAGGRSRATTHAAFTLLPQHPDGDTQSLVLDGRLLPVLRQETKARESIAEQLLALSGRLPTADLVAEVSALIKDALGSQD